MKIRIQILRAATILALLVPTTTLAGSIGTIAAQPTQATPNQTVNFQLILGGSGDCGFRLLTGDGTVLGPFGLVSSSPASVSYAYPNTGTFTAIAQGKPKGNKPACGGADKSVTITVASSGSGTLKPELLGNAGKLAIKDKGLSTKLITICQKVDCNALLAPRIEKIFGFPKPGGVVALIGNNYGAGTGKVSLTHQTWTGQSVTSQLDFIEWTPTMVGVRIPNGLQGFVEQSAKLVLTTKAGAKSIPFSFQLLPMRDVVAIPSSHVKVIKCDTDSNGWKCNGQGGTGNWFVSGQQGASIWGWHRNNWGAVGNDTGTDKFEITLKNGWRFASSQVSKYGSSSGEWVGNPSPGMSTNSTTWKPSIQWKVTPADIVDYHIWIEAEGPRGVPYH